MPAREHASISVRSWYGSATFKSKSAPVFLIKFTTASVSSASIWAVSIATPRRSLINLAIASHLLLVRLARVIFVKTSAFIAHFTVATWLTPPAPMIKIFDILAPLNFPDFTQSLYKICF